MVFLQEKNQVWRVILTFTCHINFHWGFEDKLVHQMSNIKCTFSYMICCELRTMIEKNVIRLWLYLTMNWTKQLNTYERLFLNWKLNTKCCSAPFQLMYDWNIWFRVMISKEDSYMHIRIFVDNGFLETIKPRSFHVLRSIR